MKKILPFAAALLLAVSLSGCGEPDFDGSRLGNDSQLVMEYKTLNGTDSQELELKEGPAGDTAAQPRRRLFESCGSKRGGRTHF